MSFSLEFGLAAELMGDLSSIFSAFDFLFGILRFGSVSGAVKSDRNEG